MPATACCRLALGACGFRRGHPGDHWLYYRPQARGERRGPEHFVAGLDCVAYQPTQEATISSNMARSRLDRLGIWSLGFGALSRLPTALSSSMSKPTVLMAVCLA